MIESMETSSPMLLSNELGRPNLLYPSIMLPAELWLQVLELAAIDSPEHIWTTVRSLSHQFQDYVERVFASKVLSTFAISLSLPRRDPINGTLRWWESIPNAAILMRFNGLDDSQQFALFRTPSIIQNSTESKTLEQLRSSNALPKRRLMESPPWVFPGGNFMSGSYMNVPKNLNFDWSEEHKTWVWSIEWRRLLTQFYEAKRKARVESEQRKSRPSRSKRFVAQSGPSDAPSRRR